MNIRTTLMMIAATMAPLYAQETAAPTLETYTALATAPQVQPNTPETRADAYPALAYIPADVELALAMSNFGTTIMSTVSAFEASAADDFPPELEQIDSIAIAAGKGTKELCEKLIPLIATSSTSPEQPDYGSRWSALATEPAAAIIRKLSDTYRANMEKAAMSNLPDLKLPPIYAVLSGKQGSDELMRSWYEIAINTIREDITPDSEYEMREVAEVNGYVGICIHPKAEQVINDGYTFTDDGRFVKIEPTERTKAMQDELNKRSFYVLLRREGTNILAVVCENPADIMHPADAAQSILGTDKLSSMDTNLSKPQALAFYSAPGLSTLSNEIQLTNYRSMSEIIIGTFRELAAGESEQKKVWESAAKGAELLTSTITNIVLPKSDKPDCFQIWHEEGSIGMQYTCAANGLNFTPGKLSLTALADTPATILYTESTPFSGANIPPCTELIDALAAVADGFVATANPEAQAEMQQELAMAKNFLPDAKSLCSALQTIGSGLGGSTAIAIDSAGNMPAILGGRPGNTAAIPRICFYSGVSNRSKLAEGWQQTLKVAADVATKLGSDPSVINMLPIVPTVNGNTTSFSVALPWFTPNLVPNVTVSDTTITLGTSSDYNAQVTAAATGAADFTGCVFSLKFEPLATTARGIADELTAIAEQEKATTQSNIQPHPIAPEPEPQTSDDEPEYIEEEDYDEEEIGSYHYVEPTPAEQNAAQAQDIAQFCENIARVAERLDATTTTSGGNMTIRAKITLKK